MFEAKLFPILHATDAIGLEDLLWIQGIVQDEDHVILKRYPPPKKNKKKHLFLWLFVFLINFYIYTEWETKNWFFSL